MKAPSLVEEKSSESVVKVLMNVDFLSLHSEWLYAYMTLLRAKVQSPSNYRVGK